MIMLHRPKIATVIFFSLFIFMVTCESDIKKPKKVIAKIGGAELTLDMLKNMIPAEHVNPLTREQMRNYVDRWVAHELIYQDAVRKGLNRSPKLHEVLKNAEKDFLVDASLDSLMNKRVDIDEESALQYYERNKDNFIVMKTEVRSLHILVANENEAAMVRVRSGKGEDFMEIAKQVSLDFKRNNRIDTGYFNEDDLIPEIGRVVFNTQIGSITQPIKSQFGYHLFKITDKRYPESVKSFDEVKKQIAERMVAEKREEIYKEYISSLKSKTDVHTNFDYLEELFLDLASQGWETRVDSLK